MKNCLEQKDTEKTLSKSGEGMDWNKMFIYDSDMRAFDISEHNLCDEDGVLLVTVKRIE